MKTSAAIPFRFLPSLIALTTICLATQAAAYDQPIHVLISEQSYRGDTFTVTTSQEISLAADDLRKRLYNAGVLSSDVALQRAFVRRWPNEASFDEWEFKHLCGLNPERKIIGFDDVTPDKLPLSGQSLYAQASRLVDDDRRNQERFLHDAERKVIIDSYGNPVPEDPAILQMGSLRGLSSQAHAHYQLPAGEKSDDPKVLWEAPERFAVPPNVVTLGAGYAETYTELAWLAHGLPQGGQALSVVFAGSAAHHVEDVANQIHTVQVGLPNFFIAAKWESLKEEFWSQGGLLRSRPQFLTIGIQIMTNYHTLSEELFKEHFLADPAQRLPTAESDTAWASALPPRTIACDKLYAQKLVLALAERSSHDAPKIYREMWRIARPELSKWGSQYTEGSPAQDWLRDKPQMDKFFDLENRGIARARGALALWWTQTEICQDQPFQMLAENFLKRQLAWLAVEAHRRSEWNPTPPVRESISYWIPLTTFCCVLLLIYLLARLFERARRRHAA